MKKIVSECNIFEMKEELIVRKDSSLLDNVLKGPSETNFVIFRPISTKFW
jgi:hypothetical protein